MAFHVNLGSVAQEFRAKGLGLFYGKETRFCRGASLGSHVELCGDGRGSEVVDVRFRVEGLS